MRTPETDYTPSIWVAATAVILILIGISFVPPQSFGGITLRRANILADLITYDDAEIREESEILSDEEEILHFDIDSVAECIATAPQPRTIPAVYTWDFATDTLCSATDRQPCRFPATKSDTLRYSPSVIAIEEFGEDRMGAFYDTLLAARRPVRIAVLGDSFIEGDIFTADLRERLQLIYGGGGTGFAPMASPLTSFRRTIKTQSKGWSAFNIMQRRNAPQTLRDYFHVSGWVCRPDAGASTRWECTRYRERLDLCNEARIYFISPSDSRVELIVNDSLKHDFLIEGSPALREIVAHAPQIGSVTFRVAEGHEGFIGYGAVFDGGGICVDNYSVRSNNGQALFWTNPSIAAQMHQMAPYDLVILQYGLNIMQQNVHAYPKYEEQIEKMVALVHQCFEGASVLVLGVSDRSVKGSDNGFHPMNSIADMTECQRKAAERSGAAFWSIHEAMRSWGGMSTFVANGWAGKDYTHINYAGGCRVAWSLTDALTTGISARREMHRIEATRRADNQAGIIDSLHWEVIRQELLPEQEFNPAKDLKIEPIPHRDTVLIPEASE